MSEELLNDDQSHYEVSLTAGQAFLAFVLLLLSLAASFAFGLVIGRGQADERLVVKKEPAVINEASAVPKKNAGRIVELGVKDDDFKSDAAATATAAPTPLIAEESTTAPAAVDTTAAGTSKPAAENPPAAKQADKTPSSSAPVHAEAPARSAEHAVPPPSTAAVTHYAQLLSSTDQKTAESLAARLIDKGFTSAYVERATSPKGPIFKVRVKFASEAEARTAEPKLREFSNDVWITTK